MADSMAAATRPPELRPLGVGEILDASIKVFLRNATELFKAVAIVVVPVQLLAIVVLLSALPEGLTSTGLPAEPGTPQPFEGLSGAEIGAFVGAIVVTGIAGLLATVLATGACFKGVSDTYLGGRAEWRESLRFAFRRLGPLVWVTILGGILLIPAFLALIVPGVWLGVAFLLAVPIVLAEELRGGRALKRSLHLVRGRWWSTFAVVLVGFLLAAVVSAVIGGVLGFAVGLGAGQSTVATTVADQAAAAIGSILATPFQAAIIALIYFDLRVRKEGLDVELLARGIGEAAPSPATGEEGSAPTRSESP